MASASLSMVWEALVWTISLSAVRTVVVRSSRFCSCWAASNSTTTSPFFTARPDSLSLTMRVSGTCGALRMTERVLLISPRARTEITKSARRTLATGTSTSVVPVRRYAASPAPPNARAATVQPAILLFSERFWPSLVFGFTSFDDMILGRRPLAGLAGLGGQFESHHIALVQAGPHYGFDIVLQSQLDWTFLPTRLGAHEHEGLACRAVGKHGPEGSESSHLLGLERDVGAGRQVGHNLRVHLIQLEPNRNLPHKVGPASGYRNRANRVHVSRQLQSGIGVQPHPGFLPNPQKFGVHLVYAGVHHHRRGIHNLHEHLAGGDLIALLR